MAKKKPKIEAAEALENVERAVEEALQSFTPAPEKKSKKKLAKPVQAAPSFSATLESLMERAAEKYGDPTIVVTSEDNIKVIGPAMPSLAMEYLIQNTVWPLERVCQLVGREGTMKSAFTFEMGRWFGKYSGGGITFETEGKYAGDLALSIVGRDKKILGHMPCQNLEDWQSKIQYKIQEIKRTMKGEGKQKGIGKVYPVLLVLDSVMGKLSAESINRIETDGFAGRAHPVEALKITRFFQTLPALIRRWPIAFVFTNHLKKDIGSVGPMPGRRKAGGVALDFFETFEFQINRAPKFHLRSSRAGYDGVSLEFRCYKNGLGTTDRRMAVNVHWWDEMNPDTGRMQQVTRWRWHEATVMMLLRFTGQMHDLIDDVVDLRKAPGNKVFSKKLGAVDKPISFEEAGVRIHKNKEIKNELRKLLGIKVQTRFREDMDYDKQLELTKHAHAVQDAKHIEEAEEASEAPAELEE